MRVRDLDGNIDYWKLTGCIISGNNERPRSSLHLECRELLKERFITAKILEEVPIKLHRNQVVYFDFYIPLRRLAVEVQGEQHFKYVPFFHRSIANFIKAKKLDTDKKEWCEINGITLVYFLWSESLEQWKLKIT